MDTTLVTSREDLPEEYKLIGRALEHAWECLRKNPELSQYTNVQLSAVRHYPSKELFIFLSVPGECECIGAVSITEKGDDMMNRTPNVSPVAWLEREVFYAIMSMCARRTTYGSWELYDPTLGISASEYQQAVERSPYEN